MSNLRWGWKGIEQRILARKIEQRKRLKLFNYLVLKPRKLRINLVAALLSKWQK